MPCDLNNAPCLEAASMLAAAKHFSKGIRDLIRGHARPPLTTLRPVQDSWSSFAFARCRQWPPSGPVYPEAAGSHDGCLLAAAISQRKFSMNHAPKESNGIGNPSTCSMMVCRKQVIHACALIVDKTTGPAACKRRLQRCVVARASGKTRAGSVRELARRLLLRP